MTGNQNNIRLGLNYSRSNSSNTNLTDQLYMNTGPWVRALKIKDQLLEVFNGINVVMRWWRDKTNARRRMPRFRYPWINFVCGELAAFAGFGTLRHFDL